MKISTACRAAVPVGVHGTSRDVKGIASCWPEVLVVMLPAQPLLLLWSPLVLLVW